jgi:tyrosine-protein kinase Etk/Wzc
MNTIKSKHIINKEFDATIVKTVLKKWWYVVVISVGFFWMLAFIYLRYTKPIYESAAVIQIASEDQGADILEMKEAVSRNSISREIELLRSEFILSRAIRKLNLNIGHYAEGDILIEEKYYNSTFNVTPYSLKDSSLCQRRINLEAREDGRINLHYHFAAEDFSYTIVPGDKLETPHFKIAVKVNDWDAFKVDSDKNKLYFEFNDLDYITRKYLGQLMVVPIDVQARTIEVSFKSNNPLLSKDVVDAVLKTFFEHDESHKKQGAENVLHFINRQLDSLSIELRNSKDSIMIFQRQQNIADPEFQSTSLSQRIDRLHDDLLHYTEELSVLEDIQLKLSGSANRMEVYQMIPVILGKSFESTLFNQVNRLHQLLEKREDLLFNLTPDNQTIKVFESRIDETINGINKTIETLKNRVNQKVERTNSLIKEIENQYFNLPEKRMELARLNNLQQLNEKYYNLFTEKQVQYSISQAGYTSQNKVLKKAQENKTPISPKKNVIRAISVLLGLVVGFSFLLTKYVFFNEIKGFDELRKLIPDNVAALGAVPLSKRKLKFSKLVITDAPKSIMAESFRSIRTNLSFLKSDFQLISVTSTISGEGKTFIALNLAGVIALSGKKTVIIDLDLRKPKINIGLDITNEYGMSNVLAGQLNYKEVIKTTLIEGLSVITAGPIPPNPSELILGDSFDELLQQLKNDFDVIVIDTPPVGLVSDGYSVLPKVDIPIYVFKSGYSKRSFVNNLISVSEKHGINNLSFVLNGISVNQSQYGYNSYYQEEENGKGFWKTK